MEPVKLIALDLDGTLTQHKTPLGQKNRSVLNQLSRRYKLLMVGAGDSERIFRQMGQFPVDIIGNYGMQFCQYDPLTGSLKHVYDESVPCDRDSVEERVSELRKRFGYSEFVGENVEFHSSGCITFPLLGTAAPLERKLAFDPDREKRSRIYPAVKELFPEFTVFIGGSSSFDMAPHPYDKYYALDRYCRENGLKHSQVVYAGDDYGPGGNDEAIYVSDFPFIRVDDYTNLNFLMGKLLKC